MARFGRIRNLRNFMTLLLIVGLGTLIALFLFQNEISHEAFTKKLPTFFWRGDMETEIGNGVNITTTTEKYTATDPSLFQGISNFGSDYNITDIHKRRKTILDATCAKSVHGYLGNSKDNIVASRVFIDQSHSLIFCKVQKVGSNFLWSLFQAVNKTKKTANKSLPGLTPLRSYQQNKSSVNLPRIFSRSFKVIFTREPYSRLFSGYVDKLFAANTVYWHILGKYIKETLLKQSSVKCGDTGNITFPEFIKYVIHSETTGEHSDGHFNPIYEHCRPCQISYDFIGKMETFMDDSLFLMNTWSKLYGINIKYNDFEAQTALQRAFALVSRFYKMRADVQKCMTIYIGMLRTWKSLQIQGILSKNVSLPFSEKEAEYVGKKQFVAALAKAIQGPGVDRKYLRKQKKESLIQAYSEVPMDDLVRLREVVRPDCELFGYDNSPDYIFSRNDPAYKIDPFKYFDTNVG